MDLRRTDMDAIQRLASVWKATPGAEMEAMISDLDLTGWQDITTYLRSLGMKDAPQLQKLNICLSNDLRFTLEGAGVIQAYCRDNSLKGKPFTAMVKEAVVDGVPVDIAAYKARVKVKREIPLAADDARVKEALARWDTLGKHFRMIQRFEFAAPRFGGGIPVRFDVSVVRENQGRPARTFQEGRVTSQPPRYEAEAELTALRESTTADVATRHIVRGLSWLLQGRQRSYVLCSAAAAAFVRDSVSKTFGSGRNTNTNRKSSGPFRYPGPQPATLERRHMILPAEPGVPNLATAAGGYNVTDKADGLRCGLFVSDNGRIFLFDAGGRVYATGKEAAKAMAGLILDGEWIRRSKDGKTVSHFYAFDILADKGGDTAVAGLPFMIAGAMLGSAAAAGTRQARMAAAVAALDTAEQRVRGVPAGQNLQIGMKTFRTVVGAASDAIFREAAAATLEDAKSAPYVTDGLIFTPNAQPLPIGTGTWHEQLKWKPPHDNTIDFLVIVDRERTADGKPLSTDAVGTKFRDDSGQTVRFKTLRLFVGSNRDTVFQDPRSSVLSGAALPSSLDDGEWREVEFRPSDPRDPMASVCYVAIAEGLADGEADIIRASSGDIIQSDMIVEMAYYPERAPGWRWVPQRVRHDKTERWLAAQAGAAGARRGGTMNADWVANSIWNTIHNPVTENAVRTGKVDHCVTAAPVAPGGLRRGPGRDLMRVQCMLNFHDEWIKKRLLLGRTLTAGGAVADLATGTGSDMRFWLAAGAGRVFGCDVAPANINDPREGAYSRLLAKMIALGGRDRVPPTVFAVADAARRLVTGEAGVTAEDKELLKASVTAEGYDVVSCMFGIHGMFRDANTLAGFLTNLADLLKVGGYFVGCGLDGDTVARALHSGSGAVMGSDGPATVWGMTRRYGTAVGSIVPPSEAGLGLAFDVDFTAAGWSHQEYLVSWSYLMSRLAECGLELLTAEELTTLGASASTGMFGDAWGAAAAAGERYEMSEAMRRLSFMNRWWILRRRSDRRPAPPAGPVAALPAPETLTVQRSATVAEAAPTAPAAPAAAAAAAPTAPAAAAPTAPTAPPVPTAAALSAIPEEDVMPFPAEETAAPAAPGVEKPFIINSATKAPDLRLGGEFADWPRYLLPGTQTEISDIVDPTVKYPSVEAALASAKFQRATDKPELGPTLFRVEGAIHQKFVRERAKGGAPEMLEKFTDDEVAAIRLASGKAKMKAYKADWKQEAWDAAREEVYRRYFLQRYETDAKFRAILQAIKTRGGQILFANGTEPTELGVGVLADGTVVGGENKVGKWLMDLVV